MANAPAPQYVADKLPDDLLSAIGELIVRWGRLEYGLHRLVVAAYDLPQETGRALTIGMEINVLCSVLRTVAATDHWVADAGIRTGIKELVDKVQKASGDRHDYAHGAFGFDIDDPNEYARYLFKSAQHRVKPGSERMKAPEIRKLAEKARLLTEQAIELGVKLAALRRRPPSAHARPIQARTRTQPTRSAKRESSRAKP